MLVRIVGANGSSKAAGSHVVAAEDRRSRHRARDDDVGALCGRARGKRKERVETPRGGSGGKAARRVRVEVVAGNRTDSKRVEECVEVIACLCAAANKGQSARTRVGQQLLQRRAEAAAVRCAVTSTESISARRRPHSASNSAITPWIVGKP